MCVGTYYNFSLFSCKMSTFKFNFSGVENRENSVNLNEKINWLECEEVILDESKVLDEASHAKMFACGEVEIGHVFPSKAILNMLGDNAVEIADKQHSDLVTGKYEGGLKIWECTYDLIQYLQDNMNSTEMDSIKVLDLGCGSGILGIYLFLNGAYVTFQDYNKEVLENATIPNIQLNIEDENKKNELNKCRFFSGDWESFNHKLNSEVYDLIVTSETIYNMENYEKLIDLLTKRLSKTGTAYVAAKTYYFGVGGGTRQFESSIENNKLLKSEVCWKSSGGIQREILKITHRL